MRADAPEKRLKAIRSLPMTELPCPPDIQNRTSEVIRRHFQSGLLLPVSYTRHAQHIEKDPDGESTSALYRIGF